MTDNGSEQVAENPLNPYFGKVIGFVDSEGQLSASPSAAQYNLLINVGTDDDVSVGEKVIVFALGEELFDLDTKESLGHFEIVRGEGKVVSVQTRISVVRSTRTTVETYRPTLGVLAVAAGTVAEVATRQVAAPFRNAAAGDFVRFI